MTRAPTQRSGWGSVRAATTLMLWQAAPWVLVVLVATSLLFTGGAAWGTWSGAPPGNYLEVRGDQGAAAIVSGLVGLAALFSWMRTVRTAGPVLVAGGVTRRAVTGGLLVAAVALAVVTTAMLTLVAVAGAALQRWVAGIAPGRFEVMPGGLAFWPSTSSADSLETSFNPVSTLPWFVMIALLGALLGAAWYRWRALGAVGVVVLLGVVWSIWLGVAAAVHASAATLLVMISGPRAPSLHLGISAVLAAAVWLVLRRVPLRPPAR